MGLAETGHVVMGAALKKVRVVQGKNDPCGAFENLDLDTPSGAISQLTFFSLLSTGRSINSVISTFPKSLKSGFRI